MGSVRPSGRILSRVRHQTPPLSNANGANSQSRSCKTGSTPPTHHGVIAKECNRTGVKAQHPGLLQPHLFGAQEDWGPEAYYRPQCPQRIHYSGPFQDGNGRIYSGFLEARDVDVQCRPIRRLFSHPNPSGLKEVSQNRVQRGSLPIQGTSLWGENSPVAFHHSIQRGEANGFGFGRASPPVHGRLVGDGNGSRALQGAGFYNDNPMQRTGDSCESQEIRLGSKTSLRFPGLSFQSGTIPGFSNRGQPGQNHQGGPVVNPERLLASEDMAISHRGFVFPRQVNSFRSVSRPAASATFAEHVESPSREPQGINSRSVYCQTDGLLVDGFLQSASGPSSGSPSGISEAVHRCQHSGLGCSLRRPGVLRSVGSGGEAPAHQCVGDAGHSSGSASVGALPGRSSLGVHGQLHCGCLRQPSGRDEVSSSVGGDQSSFSVCHGPSVSSEGGTHSGPAQCYSRPIVQDGADPPHGVVSSARDASGSVPSVGQTINRPVCNAVQPQMQSVCVASSRRSGVGNGRPLIRLGRDLGVRLPPSSNPGKGSVKIQNTPQLSDHSDRPTVAKTILVRRPHGSASRKTCTSVSSEAAEAATDGGLSQLPGDALSARLAAERQALSLRGFSREATRRIVAPQRSSTLSVYEGKWKVFSDWCESNQMDPFLATIPQLADFFVYLFQERRLAPSTVEGYRTALSGALRHRLDVGKDKDLTSLIQSFYQERPKVRRVIPSWDLSLVLLNLTKPPFEPMRTAELKWVTQKTLFLTLLASGSRRGEVHALSMANFRHDEQWRWVSLEPHQGFVAKTQLRKSGASVLAPIRIPAPSTTLSPELQEDRALCPVRALKIYLSRTQPMRVGKELLFISFLPSHRGDICKNTISGWVRNLLCKCYEEPPEGSVPMSNTRTHELRALSASLAFRGNIDLEDIMSSCSWHAHSTFSSFYLRDVSAMQGQLYTLGPLVVAQSVIQPPGGSK